MNRITKVKVSDVPFVVLCGRDERRPHVERLRVVLPGDQLRVFSNPHAHALPRVAAAMGFAAILDEALNAASWEPFVMLEDDVSASEWWSDAFACPADADAVYLGISMYAARPDAFECTGQHGISWVPCDVNSDIDIETDNVSCVRLLNMLSMHAVWRRGADAPDAPDAGRHTTHSVRRAGSPAQRPAF